MTSTKPSSEAVSPPKRGRPSRGPPCDMLKYGYKLVSVLDGTPYYSSPDHVCSSCADDSVCLWRQHKNSHDAGRYERRPCLRCTTSKIQCLGDADILPPVVNSLTAANASPPAQSRKRRRAISVGSLSLTAIPSGTTISADGLDLLLGDLLTRGPATVADQTSAGLAGGSNESARLAFVPAAYLGLSKSVRESAEKGQGRHGRLASAKVIQELGPIGTLRLLLAPALLPSSSTLFPAHPSGSVMDSWTLGIMNFPERIILFYDPLPHSWDVLDHAFPEFWSRVSSFLSEVHKGYSAMGNRDGWRFGRIQSIQTPSDASQAGVFVALAAQYLASGGSFKHGVPFDLGGLSLE